MTAIRNISVRGKVLLVAAARVSFQVVLAVEGLCSFVGGGHGG